MTQIAIVGAGIAGLACARKLRQEGIETVIFDKGRGIGGRVATRRTGDFTFNHGAPHITASGNTFSTYLREISVLGHATSWTGDTGRKWTFGTPGMSAIPKAMSIGLDIRSNTQITAIHPDTTGWRLYHDDATYLATHVVMTVPAPQVAGLLGDTHPFAAQISRVKMTPELTLMAIVTGEVPTVVPNISNEPLTKITLNRNNFDRLKGKGSAWVAHAGLSFSKAHLEKNLPDIAEQMLPLFCERLNIMPKRITYAAAHRWRYSRVLKSLGKPFVSSPDKTLYLGGDWCIGSKVEAAWDSGTAIATDMLEQGLC